MEKLMGINGAADLLGLSKSRLYALVQAKAIPHYKVPNGKKSKVLFSAAELLAWLHHYRPGQVTEL